MNKIFSLLFICILAMGAFDLKQYSPQQALNILSKSGRKAWYAFNSDLDIGYKRVTKFGYNQDLDTGGYEILSAFGGTWQQYDLSAETLTITFADPNDASGDTGANSLLVTCIDEDGLEQDVVVVTNGTSFVTTQTCKFVNRAVVVTAGSSKFNEGLITIAQTTSGVTLATIPAQKSVTQQLIYYVPSNQICYLDHIYLRARKIAGGNTNIRVEFNVRIYSGSQDVLYDIREYFVDTRIEGVIDEPDFKAEPVRPNEILAIEALTDTDDSIVTGDFELSCLIREDAS